MDETKKKKTNENVETNVWERKSRFSEELQGKYTHTQHA